jgi:hypothetical protein
MLQELISTKLRAVKTTRTRLVTSGKPGRCRGAGRPSRSLLYRDDKPRRFAGGAAPTFCGTGRHPRALGIAEADGIAEARVVGQYEADLFGSNGRKDDGPQ